MDLFKNMSTAEIMLRATRSFDPCRPCAAHIYGGEREIIREVITCACSAEG